MDLQFGDSTYGSYLSGQDSTGSGSSSSLTMSLSGSELLEDQPSTSGCSSDMAHSLAATLKERKKAQVKEYLRQLKEIVPPSHRRKRGRTGTINALLHVINSFKKIQDDNNVPEMEKNIDVSESGIGSSVYDTDDQIKVTTTVSTQDQLVILISPEDMTIVSVSSNLKDILGYPSDSWKGRDLLNFVNKKDTSNVSSRLKQDFADFDDFPEQIESEDDSSSKFDFKSYQVGGKKTFYFRMRHFKGLESGFSLKKADLYSTFQVTVDVKYMEQKKPKAFSPPLLFFRPDSEEELTSTDKTRKVKYLQLNCVRLSSAYKDKNLPSNRTFHTRHTLLSSYSYIHPNAIQLTGFLPHEMVGTSIFDYYHPDDMEQLYSIYKQVLSSKGAPFKSPPVRFRIKNGDWIVVETEWSSFVNPWSRHLEFIIGHHSVIKGPSNLNVFDDTLKPKSTELMESAIRYQEKIQELLIKPINRGAKGESVGDTSTKVDEIRKESKTAVPPGDEHNVEDKEITEKQCKFEMSNSPGDSEQSSTEMICENECSMAYEQLNYTNNIKKFLLSQPKSLSSAESDKKESWPSSTEEEEDVSGFDVDISVPKPPSFGSSTKVLVSEQEPREDIAGSPAHHTEETLEELSLKETLVNVSFVTPPIVPDRPPEFDHHSQISLTQQALWKHTKLQEKLFIEQSKDDRNMVVIKRNDKTSVLSDSSKQRIKRIHSPDRASNERNARVNKSSKIKKKNLMDPPFPITTTDMKLKNINQNFSQYQTDMQTASLTGMNIPSDQVETPMAVVSSAQTTVTGSNGNIESLPTSSPTSMNNLQWPYYQQQSADARLIPQVVSGFYQPGTGLFHTFNILSLSVQDFAKSTSGYNPNPTQATYTQTATYTNAGHRVAFKRPLSSDNSSSADDTSSSLLYLLESGSRTYSSSFSHDENDKIQNEHKRPPEPPWLMSVRWTKDVQMRYIVPKRKLSRVLMADKEELCRMKQQDIVIHQMEQLQHEIDNLSIPPYDEEFDYLFPIDEGDDVESAKDNYNNEQSDVCDDFDHDHGISSIRLASNFKKKMTIDSRKLKQNEISSSESSKSESTNTNKNLLDLKHQDSTVTCVFDSSHPDGESDSVEMESVFSKGSSELTPSDQRSSEEAGSSMKESDSSSKESYYGNLDSSESEMECKREETNKTDSGTIPYEKFFIPLRINFKAQDKNIAPWLMDTELNENVKMKYSLKLKELDDILKNDDKAMANLYQPDLVVNQFQSLLGDLHCDSNTNVTKSSQPDSSSYMTAQQGQSSQKSSGVEKIQMESSDTGDLFGKVFDSFFTNFPGMGDMEGEQYIHEPSFEDVLD